MGYKLVIREDYKVKCEFYDFHTFYKNYDESELVVFDKDGKEYKIPLTTNTDFCVMQYVIEKKNF